MDRNIVGWSEIPVVDLARAVKFYEAVFNVKLEAMAMSEEMKNQGMEMTIFPHSKDGGGAGCGLVKHPMAKPSMDGVMVYLSSQTDNLDDEMSRVEAAGGKVIMPRMAIGEHGFMAVFSDTEGNRVAVHSMK